ncbi:hypothetical protein GFS24_01240 [Chitinophaga sp. SYP-B3965]|uniref:hypothetical protein n=1 Tax=Chitinophaga sp. SYP-B3965 TaxID=2663120 RepID=UPI0012996750|nr:hypothetical protein [Chitinophaga sp. SYP-B3965]MRG43713.1 hypothetical protein [Chitinophaga sp. SYP-B3965]
MKKHSFLLAVILFCCLHLAAQPYTITLTPSSVNTKAPALQSFCIGTSGNYWLLIGGRTNGFHGTGGSSSTFPSSFDNQNIYVVDPNSNNVWSAPIPAKFLYQLRSTNMPYYQDGSMLYCIGGYGNGCPSDTPGCYQTFPNLTAINVPGLINAIRSGSTNLTPFINSISDNRMKVTGGTLTKLNGFFYLAFGQNYNGKYKPGVDGKYTEQVARFQISNVNGVPSVSNYTTITSPLKYQDLPQFHRRDFNGVPYVTPQGSQGFAVLGGVFTSRGGPFPNPAYISYMGAVTVDVNFAQKFCLYDCASISLYNTRNQQSYVTMIGGITDYYFGEDGDTIPSNAGNFMPWFNHASTIVYTSKGVTEYPQAKVKLPGYIGANAVFVPSPMTPLYLGINGVIDYAKLPNGSSMIGWMYGGIEATAPQSNGFNPTNSSNVIYTVTLSQN